MSTEIKKPVELDTISRRVQHGVIPYYEDDYITIYHGDCLDILPKCPKADLILTDPPFFMPATHYQSRVNWQRTWGDTSILKRFWIDCLNVFRLKETGHLIVFCNHESYPVFYPEMYGRFDYLKSIVWDKKHVGLGKVWRNQHELLIAARYKTSIFYDDKKLRADVLSHKATPTSERLHPVEKPESLLSDLIMPTTKKEDIVVDPFMGSGTTLFASRKFGRKSIGIEIEEKYCEISAKRFSQNIMDLEV